MICARDGIATYWLARRHLRAPRDQARRAGFLKVLPTTPNLSDGDGDIAIQFEQPTAANIVSRQLGWLHYILYAAPSYLARHGEPKVMSDLQGASLPAADRRGVSARAVAAAAAAWGAILPNTMETDASTVLMEACASGAGIAVLPSYVSRVRHRLTPLLTSSRSQRLQVLAGLLRAGAEHGGQPARPPLDPVVLRSGPPCVLPGGLCSAGPSVACRLVLQPTIQSRQHRSARHF